MLRNANRTVTCDALWVPARRGSNKNSISIQMMSNKVPVIGPEFGRSLQCISFCKQGDRRASGHHFRDKRSQTTLRRGCCRVLCPNKSGGRQTTILFPSDCELKFASGNY
ncbi:hypothetical protein J6590_010264 [Homalodisca vitripennis]|nr:hypothetical protein J6590_010264 [Homalodisca vitripennis]